MFNLSYPRSGRIIFIARIEQAIPVCQFLLKLLDRRLFALGTSPANAGEGIENLIGRVLDVQPAPLNHAQVLADLGGPLPHSLGVCALCQVSGRHSITLI
ncbi:hypothetical protein D3C80_1153610 [compost metagenome]